MPKYPWTPPYRLNQFQIKNDHVNFDGNEEIHFLYHFKDLYSYTLTTQCSSAFCPYQRMERRMNDVPSLPMPSTNINSETIQSETQKWYKCNSQSATVCKRKFINDNPKDAVVTYEDCQLPNGVRNYCVV